MTGPAGLLAPAQPAVVVGSRSRALVGLVAFAAGLWIARQMAPVNAGWWLLSAAMAGAAFAAMRGTFARAAMVTAVVALGGAWGTLRWYEPPIDSVARLAPGLLTIECMAETPPMPVVQAADGMDRFRIRPPSRSFVVRVRGRLDTQPGKVMPASGRLWVSLRGSEATTLEAGGMARVTGTFEPVEAPMNPGSFDMRPWALERGFVGTLALSSAALIQPTMEGEPGVWTSLEGAWLRWRHAMRERALRVIKTAARTDSEGDRDREALLAGLVLGVQDRATPATWRTFTKLGLAHVLTVSGFHLIVMTTMAMAVLRLFGDVGRIEPLVLGAAIAAYVVLVPAESPIVRAATLSLAVLFADTAGRKYDRLTLLLWVAVGLLVWRPIDLFSLGFQLSVGLTLLLLWSAALFRDRMFAPVIRGVRQPRTNLTSLVAGHLQTAVAAATMCWLVSAPWIAHVTGIFSPLAVLATVVLTPVLVMAMWVGFAALLVGMLAPALASMCGGVMQVLVDPVMSAARMADGWTVTVVRVPALGVGFTVIATLLALWWVRSGRMRHAGTAAATVVVLAWGGWVWNHAQRLPSDEVLRIDMLDVSDGSCVLLRSGGQAVLWDCGSLRSDGRGLEIVAAARAMGVSRVAAAIITHPDIDHFSRLPDVLEPLGVQRIVVGHRFMEQASEQPASAAAALVKAVEREGARIEVVSAGAVLQLGEGSHAWTLRVLSPPADSVWDRDNDHSLVALLTSPEVDVSVLLTGDIESAAIAHLQNERLVRGATIVEVPHHGSARDDSIAWVGELAPRIMMQSSGPKRVDDERWRTVRDAGLWLATPEVGAFRVVVRRDGSLRAEATAGR